MVDKHDKSSFDKTFMNQMEVDFHKPILSNLVNKVDLKVDKEANPCMAQDVYVFRIGY